MAFDALLKQFDKGPVKAKGFADDAALVIKGPDIPSLIDKGQEAINIATAFGRDNGLEFRAKKTVVVMLTRKKFNPSRAPKLYMGNFSLDFSEEAKYLGVTLDSRLTFGPHIRNKAASVKRLLFRVKSAVGQLWGPTPAIARWMYTSIVRPKLTYGSLIWAHRAQKFRKILDRVQRLAMAGLTHIRRTIPTNRMEAILDLMPLDLHILQTACNVAFRIRGWNRTKWDGVMERHHRGHLLVMEGYLGQMGLKDTHPDQYNGRLWNKQYIVDQSSMKDGTPIWGNFISCYTDGSLIQGRAGWGYLVREGCVEQRGRGGLGLQSTVFQAELTAITRVARLLQPKRSEKIVIFVDSQAALLALDSQEIGSQVVWECMKSLEDVAQHNDVSLRWVKAHV